MMLRPAAVAISLLLLPALIAARNGADLRSVAVLKANIRAGPSTDAEVLWQAWKFTPVEVLDYRGTWAEIRDFEGDRAWIHANLLGDAPAVIVTAKAANVRTGPGINAEIAWEVDQGYSFLVEEYSGNWLGVTDEEEISGWIHKSTVWGETEPRGRFDANGPDSGLSSRAPLPASAV